MNPTNMHASIKDGVRMHWSRSYSQILYTGFWWTSSLCKKVKQQTHNTLNLNHELWLFHSTQLVSLPTRGMLFTLVYKSTLKLAPQITPSLSTLGIGRSLFIGCSKLISPPSLWNIQPAICCGMLGCWVLRVDSKRPCEIWLNIFNILLITGPEFTTGTSLCLN